jgi:hypothetical protein
MHRLMTISLTLSLVLAPLTAVAVVYHYANFNPRSNPVGQAVLLKSTPATLHTVNVNNTGSVCPGCYVYLLDTNSSSQCTKTAPLIAEIPTPTYANSLGHTFTYDLTTKYGLCVVYDSTGDVTITWN